MPPIDTHQLIQQVTQLDSGIGAVVVGMDRYLNYTKIAFALHHLNTFTDCLFIATNTDEVLPCNGFLLPGSGSIVKMLETCYQKKNPIICGKPEEQLLNLIIEEHSMDKNRTIIVGDNLKTDILWGLQGNVTTLLVFTGVTTKELLSNETKIFPNYLIDSMANLSDNVD